MVENMSLEESIKETCTHLTSIRAAERKKRAEILKDYLMRNAVPSLLTSNTLKRSGYTWNHVFDKINDYIMKETENFETSKNFHNVTGPLCTSLLHLCVSGANKGQAYIKCDKIIEACLNILIDSRLRRAIGDAYLNLLYKCIFPNDYYQGYISPATWESLLDICLMACITNDSQLDNLVKIRLLLFVIKTAINCCQFTLRDSLSRLKNCCQTMLEDKKVQEFVLEIVILLLEKLSLESRVTMCEFSETVLSRVFYCYEQNMEQKKKSLFFKLMQTTIVIHHPLGKTQNADGSLAYNWDIWRKHLYSILEIICLEANFIQKTRKNNENSFLNCNYFYHTAASVYYQIFNMVEDYNEQEAENSAKKIKLTFNKNKSFTDLVEELRLNSVPWMGIILMYVKQFDHTISRAEYVLLLRTLDSLVSGNRDVNWECFEKLTCLAIKNLTSSPECKQDDHNEVFLTLWNTCIRNATVANAGHRVMHTIIQVILSLVPLKHHNVQPLLMLYLEKGMPVNDYSLKTINICFHKFYRKCCNLDVRKRCFTWLTYEDMANLDSVILIDFLIRIICNENLPIKQICYDETEFDVYDCIFMNIEKGILYSEFVLNEFEMTKCSEVTTTDAMPSYEINDEVYDVIILYLVEATSKSLKTFINGGIKCIDFVKHVNMIISVIDSLIICNLKTTSEIQDMSLYLVLKNAIKHMYADLTRTLKSEVQIRDKTMLLKLVQGILQNDYNPILNKEIRIHIEEDFFHIISDIINKDVAAEDGDSYYESDVEYSAIGLKQNCVYLLAAYCRKRSIYTDDINKCILNRNLYNFTSNFEIDCALRCIQILNDITVERPPLELLFSLMQDMCTDLFRNAKATRGLLQALDRMLEQIWSHNDDTLRENCLIMINGYLQRCRKMKMPPDVAAIVYKCVAKVLNLNKNMNIDLHGSFKRALTENISGNNHCIRLYCCHLLTLTAGNINEEDIQSLADNLMDIFIINVSENNEWVLKDESMNRTITVLQCFYALGTSKKSYIHDIIIKVLLFQNEKVLDKNIVKKMLSLLTQKVTSSEVDVYMNTNILRVLHCWCERNKSFEDLPLHLFGFDNFDNFVEKHMKWLISTDIFWRHNGVVANSDVLKQLKIRFKKSDEDMLEMCFCNIILLSLPHIVIDKYNLKNEKHFSIKTTDANKMFHSARHILNNERWSNLFVEHLGELLFLVVMHVSDHVGAAELFQVPFACKRDTFTYSKCVMSAILNFFGELIDGNIMQYLCKNQPFVILNIIFKLWDNVLRERVFDFKVLIFHAYLSFIDHIPLGYSSDAILCNFICTSVAQAIKDSQSKEEVKIFVIGLRLLIVKMLNPTPINVDIMQRSTLSKIVSILHIKLDKGYTECESLLKYITTDLKQKLSDSVDMVDYINFVSNEAEAAMSASKCMFLNELDTYMLSLSNASHTSLHKMSKFLKENKGFIKELYTDLNVKGFSEDCETSVLHKVINALTNLLKRETDEKILIEACNCLAEIGAYDMKTLITVPPADARRVRDVRPEYYFAILVLKSLSELLFDEDPTVSKKVTKVLNRLLKFRDGRMALDMVTIDTGILKSLMSTNFEISAEYKIDHNKFDKYNAIQYWIPLKGERHTEWITRITLALLDTIASPANYLNSLSAVCAVKPEFCRNVMPALFGLILHNSTDIHVNVLTEQLNQVFRHIWDLSYDDNIDNSVVDSSHKKPTKLNNDHKVIVHYLLDVVNFVRIQKDHYKKLSGRARPATHLRLHCARVAWAAALAGREWAALYYGELGAAGDLHLVRGIFRRCYVSIGEMDAIDGCGIEHLTSEHERRKHLLLTGQAPAALALLDAARARGDAPARPAAAALLRAGLPHVALQYIRSLPEDDALDDIKYECLSYLGDWNDFVDTAELEEKSKKGNCLQDSIIKAMRYSCLKDSVNVQINADVNHKLQIPLNRAKLAVARLCQSLNMENCQNVYKIIANLHLFRDIETYFAVRCSNKPVPELIEEWKVENIPIFNDYKHLETMISQRSLILEHIAKDSIDSINFSNINELQLQYAELGLRNNRIEMAQRLVATVKSLEPSKRVVLLESQISWAQGHMDIGLSLLHSIVAQESDDRKLSAKSLRQYGLWMAESKRDTGRDIIHKYLEESLKALSGNDDVDTRLKVYYDIAKFADAEYKQVVLYMNSSVFENKIKCMESMKGNAASFVQSLKSSQRTFASKNEDKKAVIKAKYRVNDVFGKLDEAEIANTKAEKESFLQLAMKYYLLSLKQSDDNNLSVFRVISLWLDNPELDFDDTEHGSFGPLLHAIPSWKFISVLPQLAPRISNENTVFAKHLRKIMERCAMDHPHHTLPLLFSLKNSDKDMCAGETSEAGEADEAGEAGEARVLASEALVRTLAAQQSLARVVAQTNTLCDAIISFAYCVPKSKELKPQAVPHMEAIAKLRDLDAIAIPTDTIPVRKNCNYSRLNSIISFENVFELVGGINYPKKISCLSSDGKKRILLIKGKDDLRQDAVMQQVFNIVNTLLEKSPVTKRNKLLIRTYKVVPMSRRSGVLQWCEGTMPLGSYLVKAHTKYHPQDISPVAARTKLKECQEQKKPNKLQVFKDILKVFKPVFHNFFIEHYLDPVTWYERRLAYTRSVATSSMVGYIMGLGDRHVQNILIDTTTAELIHIDFGIAFDQGRTLPTPETVPFRLTQDIVAGFGSCGVEGVFRRCCEKTLQLLRDNQEMLLTILEVLLCDPLYLWIIPTTPDAKSSPPCGAGLAARALLAVGAKLCGAEGGAPGGVSVAGHVARLLRAAADHDNLCQLFHGWQPYM